MEEILRKNVKPVSFFSTYKNKIILAAKLLIAFGLIGYLIFAINPKEILIAVSNTNLLLITAAVILSVLNIYLQFYKWKLTCSLILQSKSNKKVLFSLFHGFSAGVITPARIGEYFGRAIVFKDKSLLKVTLATLLDKLFLFLIVTFVGSIAGIFFIHFYHGVSVYLTISLFIVMFTLFYALFLMIFNDKFWESILFSKLKRSKRFNAGFEKIKVLRKLDKNYAIKMIISSLLFYIVFLVQYALLVIAFSHNTSLWNYIWAGNLIMFVKTIIPPFTFGELGIREGASVYFITKFGETASTGFNSSIFLFLINVFLPAVIGGILLLKKSDA